MDCIIPASNLKGKALQALAKVSDELYMETRRDSLTLIALNQSKTICGRFEFDESFFSAFEASSEAMVSCKIHMKFFLPLFKGNTEKKFDYFKLEYVPNSDFLIVKMKYKCDEILMLHKLRLMTSETLSFGVDKNGCNALEASSALYNQMLAMFNTNDDEITLEISDRKIIARNYCVGAPCRPKKMRTQINLNAIDFQSYQIKKDTSINFPLKPFRTIISFAENFEMNVKFNFEIGGKPIILILSNATFEVNFIVSSLDPYSDTASSLVATATEPVVENQSDDVMDTDWDDLIKTKIDEEFADSPESPRTKRAKMVFGRCYETTFYERKEVEVLAGNSDSDS